MLTASLRLIRHNALRIGIVIATFAAVGAIIILQQVREATAMQGFESARQQVLAEQAHAQTLGLDATELSDLQRQAMTTASEAPPTATAPFNESQDRLFRQRRQPGDPDQGTDAQPGAAAGLPRRKPPPRRRSRSSPPTC